MSITSLHLKLQCLWKSLLPVHILITITLTSTCIGAAAYESFQHSSVHIHLAICNELSHHYFLQNRLHAIHVF